MRPDDDDIHRVIAGFYDAALEPDLWRDALDAMVRAADGIAGTLQVNDMHEQALIDFVQVGMADEMVAEYQAHYAAIDPRVAYAAVAKPGVLFDDFDVLAPPDIPRHEYYADLLYKYGWGYFVGGRLRSEGRIQTAFSVQRSGGQGPVTDDARRLLSLLVPHLGRAVRLGAELGAVRLRADTADKALDGLPTGIAILDSAGRLQFANAALRAMAGQRDGIALGPEGLRFGHRVAQAAALRAIGGALTTALGRGKDTGATVQVSRPTGRRPYLVTVMPLPGRSPMFLAARPAAIVLVTDPDVVPAPPADMLRQIYRLTERETEIAIALADGSSPRQLAARLGISEATARAHLTVIYAKTGTTRHAELVSLLARLG